MIYICNNKNLTSFFFFFTVHQCNQYKNHRLPTKATKEHALLSKWLSIHIFFNILMNSNIFFFAPLTHRHRKVQVHNICSKLELWLLKYQITLHRPKAYSLYDLSLHLELWIFFFLAHWKIHDYEYRTCQRLQTKLCQV